MALRLRILLLFLLPVFSASAFAQAPSTCLRTFFIDFATGSDANNGTSMTTPWKHAPGMVGFVAAYLHSAGDCFIFKGGVTWPVLVFPMTILNSGTAANPDYYGVDKTFFSGTSFAQPIFDGQLTGPLRQFISMTTAANVIIDNIEFRNQLISNAGIFGQGMAINAGGNTTIQNVFIHGWQLSGPCSQSSDNQIAGLRFAGAGLNNVAQFNVIDGTTAESLGQASGAAILIGAGTGSIARFNIIHDIPNGILGGDTFSNNTIFNIVRSCSDPTQHENAILTIGGSSVSVNNNVIHDVQAGVTVILSGFNAGENVLVYNNVMYNNVPIDLAIDTETSGATSTTVKVFNNTLENGFPGAVIRVVNRGNSLGTLVVQNNHYITGTSSNPACYDNVAAGCALVGTVTDNSSVQMANATATSQGYTLADAFAPMSVGPLITTPRATTGLGGPIAPPGGPPPPVPAPGANLATLNITPLNSDILGEPRPSSSSLLNWDAGAYQTPPPPLNLR